MVKKCEWCLGDPIYEKYHDEEWGRRVTDDKVLFEFLILEGAQAGLSWITILKKRENYRTAFDGFDYHKIAAYDEDKVAILLNNPVIIRNKRKISSAIQNAKAFIKVIDEFGSFYNYLITFTGRTQIINSHNSVKELPPKTSLSDTISADLKKRGFSFVGSTIIYSFMQAVGFVNDHVAGCPLAGKIL